MKKFIFPYGILRKSDGKIAQIPVIPIRIKKGGKELPLILLIDSGAETSLLTKSDAQSLGINLKSGTEVILSGITPIVLTFAHRHGVKIEINQTKFEIPVLFADSNEVPRVLGREGIFENFYIIFNEKLKRTVFLLHERDSEKKLEQFLKNS